jgi:limonene-1,2-epoxide hydrolase
MAASKYTETVTDIRALIREEADTERKRVLLSNLDRLDKEYLDMREAITALRIAAAGNLSNDAIKRIAEDAVKVLHERVAWLVWMMRGVIVTFVVEVLAGAIVGFLMHGKP